MQLNVPPRSVDEKGNSAAFSQSREIIRRLETLGEVLQDSSGRVLNHRYWFVSAYIHSSKHVLRKVEWGDYQHPEVILTVQRYFFQLYQHNLKHPEAHWQWAFHRCQQFRTSRPSFIQVMYLFYPQLVAHVRFDLPRAILWACQDHKMDVLQLEEDFRETLHGFDHAVAHFMRDVRTRVGLCPPCPAQLIQAMTWLLQRERLLGWQAAVALERTPESAGIPLHFLPLDLQ
ncbi:DUF5995 family protein [Deinococcus cellulosilyticus]|uniref:Uncharacterized protein n=1 Tax=Deinococcus cellulosilyticus (strain DSM 18568 / NBRC 106333 / KACC 11606 / 5516J-15) TaxID=1223518 RepID=A0A511N3Z0_DEIC1|nr:DUF5995 family protein [Deinococcus cellulosilyticus]GEM47562.1 hypothetical protein DC3_31970 [Deinococcus cellulosilyticus NBRC 106333 = KACC 11606]